MQLEIFKEIKNLIAKLASAGLTLRENFPVMKNNFIVWPNYKSIAHAMKRIEYNRIYQQLLEDRSYHLLMGDGGILQMMYTFNKTGNSIISHRLAYFPKPMGHDFNEAFIELPVESLPVPVRFDYNLTNQSAETELFHTPSHCTFGNRQSSRIAVSQEITPNEFISFVLRLNYMPEVEQARLNIKELTSSLISNDSFNRIEKEHLNLSCRR